jgi:UDP:flavonoid glycosyltransferase YjiC (YdhE family)
MLALGSRGDVQPFVALGGALVAQGHTACIAAPADYQALVADAGLAWRPIGGSIRELMDPGLVHDALDAANHRLPLGFAQRFLEHVEPFVEQIVADCWRAAQGADVLVVSSLGMYPGVSIAERLRIPLVPAHMHPFAATRAFPDMSFPPLPGWLPGGSAYNLLTHAFGAHGLWQLLRSALNRARRAVLGLPALSPLALWRRARAVPPLVLHAYSAHVAPRPADWDARQQITGYWRQDRATTWQPPAALAAFLADGPPPVYVGFGSMLVGRDPQTVTALVVDALERAGQRGILFRGWGDMDTTNLPESVHAIDDVPHDWLFPHLAAVVTHGGAGTTAAALHAGLPPVVVPFFGDQRFWGAQVERLGVGPKPIPRAQLDATRLARAMTVATSDQSMRNRAAALGQRLHGENGAQHAAHILTTMLAKGRPL